MIKVTEDCEGEKAAAPDLEGIVVVVTAEQGWTILSSYNFWVRLAVQCTCICTVLIKGTRNTKVSMLNYLVYDMDREDQDDIDNIYLHSKERRRRRFH